MWLRRPPKFWLQGFSARSLGRYNKIENFFINSKPDISSSFIPKTDEKCNTLLDEPQFLTINNPFYLENSTETTDNNNIQINNHVKHNPEFINAFNHTKTLLIEPIVNLKQKPVNDYTLTFESQNSPTKTADPIHNKNLANKQLEEKLNHSHNSSNKNLYNLKAKKSKTQKPILNFDKILKKNLNKVSSDIRTKKLSKQANCSVLKSQRNKNKPSPGNKSAKANKDNSHKPPFIQKPPELQHSILKSNRNAINAKFNFSKARNKFKIKEDKYIYLKKVKQKFL